MFTYVYTITNGGPGTDTYVSEFYIYQQAFTNQNMNSPSSITRSSASTATVPSPNCFVTPWNVIPAI